MNSTSTSLEKRKARWLRARYLPAFIFGLLVLGIGVWAIPRRVDRVISRDGGRIWDSQTAPPRRAFTWEAARALAAGQEAQAELTTPRLADDGATLYFTRKSALGRADIYRCRRSEGSWSAPEPVREWNSPADDVGPAFSRDGRQVVFASNRFKGEGGFDLYLSERNGTRWSPPRNLGRQVNSPTDDIEPAIGPDGRLYFSSNRPAEATPKSSPDRQRASSGPVVPSQKKTARLPSDRRAEFDLYVVSAEFSGENASIPESLSSINLPDSNERAPFLAPQGTSLYFASDRREDGASRAGPRPDTPNLDLYRAVWNGVRFEQPENLGPEINTPAQETGPDLSPEGFTLLFSSNRSGSDALFQSQALEVYQATGWDTSNLRALASIWWQALLFVLGGAALLLIWRFRRGWFFDHAAAVRPLAFSLVIHCLLCMGLTFVPLATIVIDKSDELGGILDTQLFGQSLRQPQNEVAAAFTKLADLPSDQVLLVPDIARQETEPMNVPEATGKPVVTLPRQMARALSPDRVESAPEAPPRAERRPLELDRRSRPRPDEVAAVEAAAPEEVAPAAMLEEQPVKAPAAVVDRQPAAAEGAIPELPSQPAAARRSRTQPTEVELRRDVEMAALPDPKQIPIAVNRPRPRIEKPGDEPLNLETIAAAGNIPESQTSEPVQTILPRAAVAMETRSGLDRPVNISKPSATLSREKTADETLRAAASGARAEPKANPLTIPREAKGRDLPRELAAAGAAAPLDGVSDSGAAPGESPLAGAQIALERGGITAPAVTPDGGDKLEGPSNRMKSRLIAGARGEARVDALPSFGPVISLLDRLPSRARRLAVVDENVGMEAMFTLRQGETRREFIDLFGGSEASEASVDRGLAWMAAHQEKEGFWSLEKNSANSRSDTAGTGLALLPFLAAGHSPQTGKYQESVNRGLRWLIAVQKPDGDLMSKDDNPHWRMYAHGIATIALCEAYGISKQVELKEPTQRALDFIVKSQNATTGGWRYQPQDPGDTSVVGWMVMALKSGEMAGLSAPQAAYLGAQRWLASVESNKPVGGQFGYTTPAATASMTAEGLLCLQFMGAPRNHPRMRAGADFVLANLPDPARDTSYYWYYGTQMMYHMQGDYWKVWNGKLRDLLISTQVKEGPNAGTWDPRDPREVQGGRLYATSLKLLMLEIYYRHLPLYQQLED